MSVRYNISPNEIAGQIFCIFLLSNQRANFSAAIKTINAKFAGKIPDRIDSISISITDSPEKTAIDDFISNYNKSTSPDQRSGYSNSIKKSVELIELFEKPIA